jgi:hypothetical protein
LLPESKPTSGIVFGLSGERGDADAFMVSDSLHNKAQIVEFIPFIPKRLRSPVWRIGLDEQAIDRGLGDDGRDLFMIREGRRRAHGDVQIEHQEQTDLPRRSTVPMHDPSRSRHPLSTQDLIERVVGLDRMDDQRKVELTGHAELGDEGTLLARPALGVGNAVVIEPQLTEPAPGRPLGLQVFFELSQLVLEPGIVMSSHGPGMNSGGRENPRPARKLCSQPAALSIVSCDDQSSHPCSSSLLENVFSVVIEGLEVEVTVGIKHRVISRWLSCRA